MSSIAERSQNHARTLALRVKPHIEITRTWIDIAIEDTQAHARVAIGQLVAGQPAFVGLSRNGSMDAAYKRLDNLGNALKTILQKARIEFYINSHKLHGSSYNKSNTHLVDVVPTREGAIAVRDALIHGRSLPADITQMMDNVKFTLKSAVANGTDAAIRSWGITTMDQIQARVNGWLSDSNHAIHAAVSWSVIRPELRPKLG